MRRLLVDPRHRREARHRALAFLVVCLSPIGVFCLSATWHDVRCEAGPDCADRHAHAAALNTGEAAAFLNRLEKLEADRFRPRRCLAPDCPDADGLA